MSAGQGVSNNYQGPSEKDHSNSPKKKLRMELNFGADQTPTPTRFIRNCEEVGLFQDLQNVNPFEETFRKAVESGKTGSTALQNCRLSTQLVTDDTLHTPHVFPHIIENDSVLKPEAPFKSKPGSEHGQPDDWDRSRPAVTVVRQEADTSQLRPIAPSLSVKSVETVPPVQLIIEMPDGRLMQLNATPFEPAHGHDDVLSRGDKSKLEMESVILHTTPKKKSESDISPLIKEKLKARLGNAGVNCQINKQGRIGDQNDAQKEELTRSKRLTSLSTTSNSDDDEEIKRRRFLERNRAAAMRCREKRKCWVATLEQRAEQLVNQNQQLQFDLGAVRAENAQLKTLLLAHKDCPVTRTMNNNFIGPMGIEPLVNKPERVIKQLSPDETEFRQKLKLKLKRASVKKSDSQNSLQGNMKSEPQKIKRLSLDIESAKQAQCHKDTYLRSGLISNESLELETFKPVATQVIQVNPNVLNRRLSSPNIEGPLLPISPNTDSMDYS